MSPSHDARPGSPADVVDVVVVGGGQAGLAAGYFLRRAGLEFVILDAQSGPGGAWRHGWDSLRLFSPARFSRLPGWPMPPEAGEPFPTAGHVRRYLTDYEARYDLPIHRSSEVDRVVDVGGRFEVRTRRRCWHARTVISATGTWRRPYVPRHPGRDRFGGEQLHTVSYRRPDRFAGRRVVVVGGGNSAAQILAEISTVADTLWVSLHEPAFLPDDVDGRVLFERAGRRITGSGDDRRGLGDIVMVPPVLDARARGVLKAVPMFDRLTATGVAWDDGSEWNCDAVVWCTGFRPDLAHLDPLGLGSVGPGVPDTDGTRSRDVPSLRLLGYGDWTGVASATIMGAARTAKSCVAELVDSPT